MPLSFLVDSSQPMSIFLYGLLYVLLAIAAHGLSLAVYRLYFSPLVNFPGPKLSAATQWVETYYEIIHKGGGQFMFKIDEWHDRYGPIIRINPHELHISDPDFYESIYHTTLPLDKPESMEGRYGLPTAIFSTANHYVHYLRRSPIMSLFSKKSILEFSPVIHACTDEICQRLRSDFVDTARPLVLNDLWASLSTDIVTSFNFGYSYRFIAQPEFRNPVADAAHMLEDLVHWTTQIAWLRYLVFNCPQWLTVRAVPSTKHYFNLQRTVKDRILATQRLMTAPDKQFKDGAILFERLLASDLPSTEKSLSRLVDEGSAMTAAGTETTRWALTVTCFHILNNPLIYDNLRAELDLAIPNPVVIPTLPQLEQLPYLSACIEEGLRLSYGVAARSPRISPINPIRYDIWVIPPGTPVSTQAYTMHHNESIFENSHIFRPERWLQVRSDGPRPKKKLSRYMVAFGRGTRMCIGMNLAYAEMYIALATIIRRFRLSLTGTTLDDVECKWAALGARPQRGSKGVRVLVADVKES